MSDFKKEHDINQIVSVCFQNWEAEEAGELNMGDRINILLSKKGMSQREFAQALHITEASVSRYINNSRTPKGPLIAQMARVLGVSTDLLLGVSSPEKTLTRQELMIEADMLQGNINRMMVTKDPKELMMMYEFAERRLQTIHRERVKELDSVKGEQDAEF